MAAQLSIFFGFATRTRTGLPVCNMAVLQFFGEYPAMGVHPLLLEWHGLVMTIIDAR